MKLSQEQRNYSHKKKKKKNSAEFFVVINNLNGENQGENV